jgi:hypothetical protein
MINLIPRSAKKNIVTEYWVRVSSTWLLLWAFALVCGTAILFPAYIFVSSQVSVYEETAALASQKVADYESASVALVQASQQAREILQQSEIPSMSSYIDLFTSIQGSDITITRLSLIREESGLSPVSIIGSASDRQSLASFRDRMLAHPLITEVDLPISNLATDRNIQFSITVTMANSTDT